MPKQIKVLFLPTSNAGVVWHRMLRFFYFMQKDPELSLAMDKYNPEQTSTYEWQHKELCNAIVLDKMQRLVDQADIVVIGYVITDYGIAILQGLKTLFPNKMFITEIDDYVDSVNCYSPAFSAFRPDGICTNAVREQMYISNAVLVSTKYLEKQYKEYNSNIFVVPNSNDFTIWDKVKEVPRKNKRIRIGWSGASTHDEDLRLVEKVILRILEKNPNVEFHLFGGYHNFVEKNKHPRIKFDPKWRNPYDYPQALKGQNYDIGIAPLLDNAFNRGKSNLRWLEYSAIKVPTVASNVQPFRECIKEGKNGFLCSEENEWEKALQLLIDNQELRKEVGLNAYNDTKVNYNAEVVSKKYASILKEIHNDPERFKKQISSFDAGSTDERHRQHTTYSTL